MPTLEDPSLKGNQTSSSGYGEPPTGSAFSLGDRDYLERQNSLTQPGSPEGLANQEQYGSQSNQFPSGYLGSQTIGSQTTPQSQVVGSGNTGVRSRLLSKTNEKLVNTVKNTKVGQVASKATETYDKAKKTYSDIKSVGKLLATGGTDIGSWLSLAKEHALPLLKKHWPILVALILVAEMPMVLIAIAIATSLGSLGNPAGGVAVAANTQYSNARCSEMQSTLVWKMQDGKAETLTFYATEGQFSHEEPYDIELKKGISFNELRNKTDPKAQNYFPDSWKPYYASARMGYAAFNFDATHDKVLDSPNPPFKGMTHESSYVGRRVIFYNPANGKSVVAILADWGPGPSVFKERTDTVKQQQRELWNGPGSADGFRLTNPPNDPISLIGGGPSTIGDQIGADEYTPVEMGFATDQTLDPTKPFKCTPVSNNLALQNNFVGSGNMAADCKNQKVPNEADAKANLTKINFNAWVQSKSGGAKKSTQISLQVHKCAAASLKNAMDQIYSDPSQFALYSTGDAIGTYSWRCKRRDNKSDDWCGSDVSERSVHSWGLAIDINPDFNPFESGANSYAASGNQFAIQANGSVVKIMAQNGWFWGGNWHSSKDYMHFSPLNE